MDIVRNEDNKIYVSIVSLWEMAIKTSIGKLEIKNSMEEIAGICLKYKMELLAINLGHLNWIANLPQIHGDPFDRLLTYLLKYRISKVFSKISGIPYIDMGCYFFKMREKHRKIMKLSSEKGKGKTANKSSEDIFFSLRKSGRKHFSDTP